MINNQRESSYYGEGRMHARWEPEIIFIINLAPPSNTYIHDDARQQ